MKYLFFSLLFSIILTSCYKEEQVKPIDKEPIPEKGIEVYGPAKKGTEYYGYGFGSGYKNGNKFAFFPANWELPERPNTYVLLASTFGTSDSIILKEQVSLLIEQKAGFYKIPYANYTILDDGDVVGPDHYAIDTSQNNWVRYDVVDTLNNFYKGEFELHFYMKDSLHKIGLNNPNRVHFTRMKVEAKFWK